MPRNLAIAMALILVSVAACSSGPPPRVIEIGVDLPLTGVQGRAGKPALNGAQFFVDRHPNIDGFTVRIVSRDDAVNGVDSPAQGESNVQSLAADPLVAGIIGPFDSSVARRAIPIANGAHLALISPAVSSRCLTKEPYLPAPLSLSRTEISCKAAGLPSPAQLRPTGNNNFFRLATTDDVQGPAAADFAYKNLQVRRMAVLSDREAYGQALAAAFTARFQGLGGSVVGRVDFDPAGSINLIAFMRAAKADGAQAIYFGGVTSNHGCVIRAQMASVFAAGEAAPLIGGDGIAQDPDCVRNAGPNAVGIYGTVPTATPEAITTALPIIAAFKAKHPNPADYGAYTIAAYDAAGVLYAAIDRAIKSAGGKLPARDAVVTELAATTSFSGATGTIGFDKAGDTTLRLVSLFESKTADPTVPWTYITAVDYSASLPY